MNHCHVDPKPAGPGTGTGNAQMLEQMGDALTNLQFKYCQNRLADRRELQPELVRLLQESAGYQSRLLNEELETTEADLAVMKRIKAAIDAAVDKQQLAEAMNITIAFMAAKTA